MPRTDKAYLNDILGAISKIEKYINNISFSQFSKNELVQDGVVRNLEIIGEAIKNISFDIKQKTSEIEWKKISGLRDILIHAYFGVDRQIIWDIVKNKLPDLKIRIIGTISDKDMPK